MSKRGSILIIEDDDDDKDMFVEIIKQLKITNKVLWFNNCDAVYLYLKQVLEPIFIIFSYINLPKNPAPN